VRPGFSTQAGMGSPGLSMLWQPIRDFIRKWILLSWKCEY
jgi:hypothetical protein